MAIDIDSSQIFVGDKFSQQAVQQNEMSFEPFKTENKTEKRIQDFVDDMVEKKTAQFELELEKEIRRLKSQNVEVSKIEEIISKARKAHKKFLDENRSNFEKLASDLLERKNLVLEMEKLKKDKNNFIKKNSLY